jgi:excisionase family DNA binding protein
MKVSRGTVENLCEEGKLRAWRLKENGWWRIDYSSVVAFLASRKDGFQPSQTARAKPK